MLWLFQDFIFGDTTSSDFFRVATSTQQLLFRGSFFSRTAAFAKELLFQNCNFFAGDTFQNSFCLRAKLSHYSHFLRIGSYLGQLFSGIAIFLAEKLLRTSRKKISTEELLFQCSYFCATSFWRGLVFQKNIIPY